MDGWMAASIFFETVVADALMEQAAADPAERFQNGFYECESAAAFLLNIPARLDFEVAVHEAREGGAISSPEDLSKMMVKAWTGRSTTQANAVVPGTICDGV